MALVSHLSVGNAGVVNSLSRDMPQYPMYTNLTNSTAAFTGSSVSEGGLKPLSLFNIQAGASLQPRNSYGVFCLSDEMVRFASPGSNSFLQAGMAQALIDSEDADFLTIVDSGSFTGSGHNGDGTAKPILSDIETLLNNLDLNARSKPWLVVDIATAKGWACAGGENGAAFPGFSAVSGGVVAGIPVVISDNVDAQTITLIDASAIAFNPGRIVVDSANHATLELDDAPNGMGTRTSLWQQGLRAVRLARVDWGFEKLRDNCVGVLSGASY